MFVPCIIGIILFIPTEVFAVFAENSPVTCQSNNTACDLHGDSLIDSFSGVETVQDCRDSVPIFFFGKKDTTAQINIDLFLEQKLLCYQKRRVCIL